MADHAPDETLSLLREKRSPSQAGRGDPTHKGIVLAIGQLGLGGAEKQVTLLARELLQRGADVTVMSLFRGSAGPYYDALTEAGVPVHLGDFPRFWHGSTRDRAGVARAFIRLVGDLRALQPEVVHGFLYQAYVLAAPAARLAGVPVVVAGRRSLGHFKEGKPVMLAVERLANHMTAGLVANSQAVSADVFRQERVPRSKLSVIHNGLPREAFEAASPWNFDAPFPVVLSVGSLKDLKGHRFLITAAGILADRGRPVTVVLAGEGPCQEALRSLASCLSVDLQLLGPRTDVPSLLWGADIFVLPSLEEGFSNALLEAMGAGRPIVATDVGGNAEALAGTGRLVPPADPVALADALDSLLSDPRGRRTLGAEARHRAFSSFGLDAMVDAHLALYERLFNERRLGRTRDDALHLSSLLRFAASKPE